jgi:hypothetical protein
MDGSDYFVQSLFPIASFGNNLLYSLDHRRIIELDNPGIKPIRWIARE